ncbi:MAG: hypothetical protein F6K31_33050 [Symploca sp. SIO2G7]|nr:hypothetical protein [Symploca sp. SIO2G7]
MSLAVSVMMETVLMSAFKRQINRLGRFVFGSFIMVLLLGQMASAIVAPSLINVDSSFDSPTEPTLIAASGQLSQMLRAGQPDNRVGTVYRHVSTFNDYRDAYSSANSWFYYIVNSSTVRYVGWNIVAGNIYEGQLLGGGTARLRNYGASGPFPTIDVTGHNTAGYSNVKEFKFKYPCCAPKI